MAEEKTVYSHGDAVNELKQYNWNISHQEVARVVLELENYAIQLPEGYFVPITASELWLVHVLGYGDVDELEDALGGSLERFIRALPQFEVQGEEGETKFRLTPKSAEAQRPRTLALTINSVRDLFTVMVRGQETTITIPEIEFEMGRPDGREIDTLYNYIGGAVFQLGQYIKESKPGDEVFDKIYATMQMLNAMLDVESPFTIIAIDPVGEVSFKPDDRVVITYTD